jgi:hypothetical protein
MWPFRRSRPQLQQLEPLPATIEQALKEHRLRAQQKRIAAENQASASVESGEADAPGTKPATRLLDAPPPPQVDAPPPGDTAPETTQYTRVVAERVTVETVSSTVVASEAAPQSGGPIPKSPSVENEPDSERVAEPVAPVETVQSKADTAAPARSEPLVTPVPAEPPEIATAAGAFQ